MQLDTPASSGSAAYGNEPLYPFISFDYTSSGKLTRTEWMDAPEEEAEEAEEVEEKELFADTEALDYR